MTDDDTDEEWQNWFDDWQLTTALDGRMIPIVPSRGNHESESSVYDLFDTPNSDSYYAITWENNLIRTYTLNSEISVLGDQLTWLESDLAASTDLTWKMAQYHKPMRPHTSDKSEGDSQYGAWAELFYNEQVKLVVDCDSHLSKTTWPIRPSSEDGNDEGFVIDEENGTVYTGEGCWGASLRANDDDKSWTRNSGSFNQFKLVFIDEEKIELRTIDVDNAEEVIELSTANTDPFTLPSNLNIFSPDTGAVVTISNNDIDNPCEAVGTVCDDGNDATLNDQEDGFCNCIGDCIEAGTPCDDENDSTINDVEDGFCNCRGYQETATLLYQINDVYNDSEEAETGGEVYPINSDLELVFDANASDGRDTQTVGLRFTDIFIPQGAQILNASIQFTVDETSSETTNLQIRGEKTGHSLIFTEDDFDISSRQITDATVNWLDIPEWTAGDATDDQRTPELRTIVQEIIDQEGWELSNALSFIITGTGSRTAESFDGLEEGAPQLIVSYSIFDDCLAHGTPCDDNDPNTVNDEEDGFCNCEGVLSTELVEQNVPVLISTDDAEETISTGSVDVTGTNLELINNGTDQLVGLRFDDVQIPEGSTLYRAYIQFQTADNSSEDPTNLSIHGELSPSSNTFTETVNNISNRPLTNTFVSWNELPLWNTIGDANNNQRTPYVTTIVEEIIAQDDWVSGNAITFILSGSGKRVAESIDGLAAPVLKLFYQAPCDPAGTSCDDGDANTVFDIQDGNCNCAGLPETGMLTYEVNNSNNDAEEEVSNGGIGITSTDLELVDEAGSRNQLVGIRFTDINLPAEATITNAYIQFTVDDDNDEQTDVEIRSEANANSLEFSDTNFDISSRTTGTNVVNWNAIPAWNTENIGEAGLNQRTSDISVLVQEILSQPDWNALQPMTFIISGSGEREAESFDGTAAPQLVIEYSFITLSTDSFEFDNTISIYPNPVKDQLFIKGITEISEMTVYNLLGQEVLNEKLNNIDVSINMSSLNNGVYFVVIKQSNTVYTRKIIVE